MSSTVLPMEAVWGFSVWGNREAGVEVNLAVANENWMEEADHGYQVAP